MLSAIKKVSERRVKMLHTETRMEEPDLRLSLSAKHALQSAAQAARRPVSDLVLERALARAAEILPDHRHFWLNSEDGRLSSRSGRASQPSPAPGPAAQRAQNL
jgi:uncharacterized protein (DUF1778 family)